jgi:hypothetical protein
MKDFVAPTMSWSMSDGFKGDKQPSDVFLAHLTQTWGFMASDFRFINPTIIVDAEHSVIVIAGTICLFIDGKLPHGHIILNNAMYKYTLDDALKIVDWEGVWDNKEPKLLEALSAVTKKLEEAKAGGK